MAQQQPRSMSRANYQALRTTSLGQPGQTSLLGPPAGKRPSVPRKSAPRPGGGTAEEKDLSKGWSRCVKKLTKALHSVTDKVHDWLGIEYSGDWWEPPLTIETLEDAVRDPDPDQVERLCDSGVDPNEPIDEYGHTVLDALAVEQHQMILDCQDQKQNGIGPEQLTQMFLDHEDAFFQVMDILKHHDAKMTSQEKKQHHPYVA